MSDIKNLVTITYDLVTPHSNHSAELLIAAIRSNQYKMTVHTVRQLAAQDKRAANEVKKYLPAATFSCRYERRRCAENVTGYTGIMVLDADNLSPSELVRMTAMLPCCRFTYAFFISPSGNGIKILIRTNSKRENHRQTYAAVMDYYASLLSIKFDPHCSDICRLTFLSWDPQAYLNAASEVFDAGSRVPLVQPAERPKRKRSSIPCFMAGLQYNLFAECVQRTNRYMRFEEGNRNNYCYRLARRCKLRGIDEAETLEKILNHFDYDQKEIVATVRSAFKR
jgi:hypothetical protein